jgi:5-methylcytosine-specific restriction protein A
MAAHAREVHGGYQSKPRLSAAKRGYDRAWRRIRTAKLSRDPWCEDPYNVHAGQLVLAHEVDHIVPLVKGGTNAEENLQSLCRTCHQRKTNTEDGGGWKRSG